MRSFFKLIVLIVSCSSAYAQILKVPYTINNGVHITGVDGTNPVIYDNDLLYDTPDGFFLWLKANKGQVRLVGNINTRDMHNQPNYTFTHDDTFNAWVDLYNRAQQSGLRNIPAPIKGTSIALVKPASGVIEQTQWSSSPGVDLIIAEARKATPEKPLVIMVGGNVSSVANAYLKDNSIANKIVVFHIDGYRYNQAHYNTTDFWSSYVVMKRIRYINWSGNLYSWYDPYRPLLGVDFTGMPTNPFTDIIRYWYTGGGYYYYKDIGDAPAVLWFFNNALWRNVARKLENDQTTTSDTFDYLLVSDNDWGAYGPFLSSFLRDPNNYTSAPTNSPPAVNLTGPANNASFTAGSNITLTATASDTDGSISRVEFFYGTTKLGEDLSSPYSFAWNNVTAGTYTLTARATDNQNATQTSSTVTITVTAPNSPPSVALTAPANNASFPAGTSITLTATASDNDGSITKVEFFNGTTKLGEDASSPYSFTWTGAPAGTHSLTAKATDNQNALSTSSASTITVIAANVPPAVTLSAPANNASFAAGTSITLTATASDNDGSITKVEFFNGTTKLGEDASSPYSFTWTGAPAGTHSLTAKATDNQNALSTSSASTITVTAANVPPAVTLSAPANNASFAAGTSITLTATASDNDGSITKVEFFNGTTKLGEDASSPYSFTWTGAPAGTHSLTAKATDNQNALSTSSASTITVIAANVPPAVTLSAPANNASFAAGTSITLTATASDNDGSITKVEFFNGTTKLGEDASSPYSFTWTGAPAGTHSLTAKATDNQNALSTSSASTITVIAANVPPAVTLSAPANNASFAAGTSITLTATASDNDGSITKVEFYNGTTKLGEDASSPYSFTWTGAPAGTHSLTAKATDNQNALSTSSASTITVIAANVPPAVTLSAPANNASFAAGTSITLTATASDNDGSITKVEFYNGTTKLGEDASSPYSFTWTGAPAGTHSLTAKATDNQNALSTSSASTITVIAANVPPAVTLSAPANNASFAAGTSITLTATASDNDGSITKVEFYNGTTKLGEDASSPYSFTWTGAPAGTHSLTAKATDNQNALSTSSASTITVIAANVPPAVTLSAPANNASFAAGTSITLTATASDNDGSITKVEFFNGTTKLGEDASSPYSFTWTGAPAGTHSLTAKATDNQNALSTSSASTITVIAANVPPAVTLSAPANNASFAAGTSITLTATASDNDGSITKVEFYNGTTKLGEDASTPYSFTWPSVPVGTYSLTAKATDNQNALTTSSTSTITVIANNVPPAVALSAPANNASFAAGSAITLTATASDNDGSITKVEFYNGTTKLGEDASNPYSFTWTGVLAGTYSLTAKATDNQNAANTSSASTITVIANNVLPAVALSAPTNNASFAAGSAITLTATASDNDGSITKVEFYNGTTKLGEDASTPYSFTWPSVPVGTYSLTAKATDNQNAVSTSAASTITVIAANVPPAVALSAPANNASFAAGSAITLTATASDNDGSITKVEFYNGMTKLGEDASSPYSFTWPSVPAGTYSLTAKATDNQNAANTSSASTITVIANNVPPTIALSAPTNNASFTAGSSITLTATASDADGTISKVEFFSGATKLGEDATSPYSFVWSSVVAGNYELTAKATDNKNAVSASAKINISVNAVNTVPTVAITSPSDDFSIPTGTTVTIVASASDANGSVTKVEFYNGTAKLGEDTSNPYNLVWSNISAGSYVVTAKATDNHNAVATSDPVIITVKNTVNPTADAGDDVFLTLPENSVTLNGSGNSADGSSLIFSWLQVSGPGTVVITNPSSQRIDLNNLIEGTYLLELSVTDEKGLVGTDQITITVATDLIVQGALPRYFTPNGDGVNDFWEWPQTEIFEKSILMVFNRSGQKVYETTNYNNTWDGKSDGKLLSEDAYYYIIKLSKGDDIRGAVRIVR